MDSWGIRNEEQKNENRRNEKDSTCKENQIFCARAKR